MPDRILDSKYRVLETLPKVAGRSRYLVSDLMSGKLGVLESVALEGFGSLEERWSGYWEPLLRSRAERFGALSCTTPVLSVGRDASGPYYVYEDSDERSLRGEPPERMPSVAALRTLLVEIEAAARRGLHFLNLRPEHLVLQDGRVTVLPGAYLLPLELLARAAGRSPHMPPELRYAGQLGASTDGYILGVVLVGLAERCGDEVTQTLAPLADLLALEPHKRRPAATVAAALGGGRTAPGGATLPPRRAVERPLELEPDPACLGGAERTLLEALDQALTDLREGRTTVLEILAPENGAGLQEACLRIDAILATLSERPQVTWVERLTEVPRKDAAPGTPSVYLVPDAHPEAPALISVRELLRRDRLRPAVFVLGRRGQHHLDSESSEIPASPGEELHVRRLSLRDAPAEPPHPPTSQAAQQLLDLLAVLEVEAPLELVHAALPHATEALPAAITELETSGHVRRVLQSGGWWGPETKLVLRPLRPDALGLRRQGLTLHRREELHLLISHLLARFDSRELALAWLRFEHLFAGGNWEAAAAVCGPLLQAVERRGLKPLMRRLQRQLVNSNLSQHFTVEHLLQVLRSLGDWEVARNHVQEGRSYYERAADRLFGLKEEDAARLPLEGVSDMILKHADLLERHAEFEPALELLQRFLDRFDERLPAVARGRVFSEMAYCEYRLGRFKAAEERGQLALRLLDARRQPSDVAQVYSVLGLVRWKTSRYDEAESFFNSSMGLRQKVGDRLAMARTYNNLGLLERSRGRFQEALEYHRRSMEIRQEHGDVEGVARNVLNLAWVHFEMRDLGRAEEFAQRACSLGQGLGMRSLCASAKGLLGEVHLNQDRLDEARESLAEAVELAREVGDAAELFMDLRKQANLELRCGALDRAQELLHEAERYLPHAGSPLEEANWHLTWGQLHEKREDARGAALAFERAGNNFARVGNMSRAAEMFVHAARLYHASGVRSRAHDLVRRTRQLFDHDPALLPKELLDLEAALGEEAPRAQAIPEAARVADSLTRACTLAAGSGSTDEKVESLLAEMAGLAGAACALLVNRDGSLHRRSFVHRVLRQVGTNLEGMAERRREVLARALESVLPLGPETGSDAQEPAAFMSLPLEANPHVLGCVYLEWQAVDRVPEEGIRQHLQTLALVLGMVLEPRETRVPAAARLSAPAAEEEPRDETTLDRIIGRSAARQAIVDFVRQVRDLDATVLLLGENGTGKEVVSRAIHFTGARRRFPFVTVNCTAIPEGLWERELFGHERGAFTDAFETKRGHFEMAHRGTLLLDEIGDMPWEMQTKFLRVLEDKSFTRLGGTQRIEVDVRIIAATNQNLEEAVHAGRFRRDLYHRLNVLSITLPPLRDRRDDIPELAQHFLDLHAARLKVPSKRISGEALRLLLRYDWPGNVRELENAMKGSLVLSDREVVVPEVLPAAILKAGEQRGATGELDMDAVASWVLEHATYSVDRPLMADLERALARQMVEKVGEKAQSARLLGISRPTLYGKLRP